MLFEPCRDRGMRYWLRAWGWILARFAVTAALAAGPDIRDVRELKLMAEEQSSRWRRVRQAEAWIRRGLPSGVPIRMIWRVLLLSCVVGVFAAVSANGLAGAGIVAALLVLALCWPGCGNGRDRCRTAGAV